MMEEKTGKIYLTEYEEESTDFLYEIATFLIENNFCSINQIQNQFGLGFNRAMRIVGYFKEFGIVGQNKEILISKEELLSTFEENGLFVYSDEFVKMMK